MMRSPTSAARARPGVGGQVVTRGRRTRVSFAKIPEILDVPDLIEVQRRSFEWFLREGIREVFDEVSPIQDFTGNLELHFAVDPSRKRVEPPGLFDDTPVLDFGGYRLERLKYTEDECRDRDYNYSAALKVKVRLVIKETGEIKEQEVFMGDLPLMTRRGTFIINGAERVVVSQLVRSPGVYTTSTPTPWAGPCRRRRSSRTGGRGSSWRWTPTVSSPRASTGRG